MINALVDKDRGASTRHESVRPVANVVRDPRKPSNKNPFYKGQVA
jgi:hypothetical protein